MWDVCISTPLNRRHAGESVTIENMEAKMAETLRPRAADEVEALDTGEIPGDRKGTTANIICPQLHTYRIVEYLDWLNSHVGCFSRLWAATV